MRVRIGIDVRTTQLGAARRGFGSHVYALVGLQFPIDARPAGAECPVVRTLHDVNPLLLPAEYKSTFHGLRRLTYLEQLPWYAAADAVVAISPAAWEDAHPYLPGVDPARVHVIYNAVPDAFVPVTEPGRVDAVRARYGLEGPYLLVCSAGGGNKNFERVVQAFARTAAGAHGDVGPLDLVLAGMLPERFVERLLAHAAEHGLPLGRLGVLGFIPEADLVAVFAGARALVSASLYEGFGLPAAQAMRVGVPVLAGDTGAYPEVVGDAGLCVDPRAVDAIAAAMARLARDGALRAELAVRGRARADRFTTAV